jgi:hypothetical protein
MFVITDNFHEGFSMLLNFQYYLNANMYWMLLGKVNDVQASVKFVSNVTGEIEGYGKNCLQQT